MLAVFISVAWLVTVGTKTLVDNNKNAKANKGVAIPTQVLEEKMFRVQKKAIHDVIVGLDINKNDTIEYSELERVVHQTIYRDQLQDMAKEFDKESE